MRTMVSLRRNGRTMLHKGMDLDHQNLILVGTLRRYLPLILYWMRMIVTMNYINRVSKLVWSLGVDVLLIEDGMIKFRESLLYRNLIGDFPFFANFPIFLLAIIKSFLARPLKLA